jgi:chromosome partitioning protein
MPTITVATAKGGQGKTTVTANIAQSLTRFGRVLVIDTDPQQNLSMSLNVATTPGQPNLCDLLQDDPIPIEQAIRQNVFPRLHVLPGSSDLEGTQSRLSAATMGERYLTEALAGLDAIYEWIVIDTPPNLGLLTTSAIMASDAVIGVLELEAFALHGVTMTVGYVDRLRARGLTSSVVAGLVINRYQPELKLSKENEELLSLIKAPVFHARVPKRVKIAEAAQIQMPLERIDPNTEIVAVFEDLTDEIVRATASISRQEATAS